MDADASTVKEVSRAFMRLIRENLFDGRELALIEPVNGPRPAQTHCAIGFVRARAHQHPVKRWENRSDGLYEVLRGTRYCDYRLTFFGVGAYQKAVDCQNWMKSALGAEFMLAPIIGFGQLGEVQEATTEFAASREERAFFNIELYAKFSSEWKWQEIAKVNATLRRDAGDEIRVEVVNDKLAIHSYFYFDDGSTVLRKNLLNAVDEDAYFFLDGDSLILRRERLPEQLDDDEFFFFDTDALFLRKETLEGVGT